MLNEVLAHFVHLFMVSGNLLMVDVLPYKGVYFEIRVDDTHVVDVKMVLKLLSNSQ